MSVPINKRLPEKVWKLMLQSMPIPCVDLICINDNGEILWGWRRIPPLNNRWALLGGRIIRGESPLETAQRQAKHYGISYQKLMLNGIFSWNSKARCDVTINFVALGARGNGCPREEFTKLEWKKEIPEPSIPIHRQAVKQWRKEQ